MMEMGENMNLDGGYELDGGRGEANLEYVSLIDVEYAIFFNLVK